jgi:hypothetical protein
MNGSFQAWSLPLRLSQSGRWQSSIQTCLWRETFRSAESRLSTFDVSGTPSRHRRRN